MKSELTLKIEKQLYKSIRKIGTYVIWEITPTFKGNERVDCMTYNGKTWRCYEIKTSVEDFYSKAAKTFIGHYNYYVLTQELYNKVKDEIPDWVGVWVNGDIIKNPKKQELKVNENELKNCAIRSLERDAAKFYNSEFRDLFTTHNKALSTIKNQNKRIRELEKELQFKKIEERLGDNHICL